MPLRRRTSNRGRVAAAVRPTSNERVRRWPRKKRVQFGGRERGEDIHSVAGRKEKRWCLPAQYLGRRAGVVCSILLSFVESPACVLPVSTGGDDRSQPVRLFVTDSPAPGTASVTTPHHHECPHERHTGPDSQRLLLRVSAVKRSDRPATVLVVSHPVPSLEFHCGRSPQ
ncbi:hypothetical protein HPB50_001005 [Hyalomma asiaticum]|uniref:Uncharacterized protein n=1 Tax=Hyalomma asiaticum TaxID=266040 RepID=A0ACB7SL94_HYAAI|nr:hypothetical protein HPB50_001005 [Hyalomma asiaticum]